MFILQETYYSSILLILETCFLCVSQVMFFLFTLAVPWPVDLGAYLPQCFVGHQPNVFLLQLLMSSEEVTFYGATGNLKGTPFA